MCLTTQPDQIEPRAVTSWAGLCMLNEKGKSRLFASRVGISVENLILISLYELRGFKYCSIPLIFSLDVATKNVVF